MPFEREIRELEVVERWGIVRAHRRGSVAGHSHRVAIYADQIAEIVRWAGDRAMLLRHALWHDMAEQFTGDMPGPYKHAVLDPDGANTIEHVEMTRRFPHLEWQVPGTMMGNEVLSIVKAADLLDELLWTVDEQRMGNGLVEEIKRSSEKRLIEHLFTMQPLMHFSEDTLIDLMTQIRGAIVKHQIEAPKWTMSE